jgi:hypothetical protein
MMRSRVVTGIAVVTAVAAGGVGGALIGVPGLSGAQPFPKNATSTAASGTDGVGRVRGDSALLDAAAKALNLTTQQLTDKLSDGKTTIADVAKQQNVDVNKVIVAMAAVDRDRISNIVNKPWPKFSGGPPLGPGLGGHFGERGLGRLGAIALDPAAKALGISTEELKTDLAKGQTIAQIAKSKNVDLNKVIDALVADASSRIDSAVKAGHLAQAQGDDLKTRLKAVIAMAVNNAFPKGPFGGHFGGGFGFPGRGGVGGPPSTPTAPNSPTS